MNNGRIIFTVEAEAVIRPYHQGDREMVLKIAADTAFFGEPVEKFMEDRRIFLDAFYVYYTDHEAEHCWVATHDENVIGFLTGCFDTSIQREYSAKVLEPQTFLRLISGKYRIGKKFIRYLLRYFLAKLKSPTPSLDISRYPAHFHINIAKEWRGRRIGRKLIEKYLEQLRLANIVGVHLQTTSYNKTAVFLYEKMGFELLFSTPSFLWQGLVNEPIFELTYGMKLCQE
jgi:ribosomal protein S18 acetylase RimI-like enzyme